MFENREFVSDLVTNWYLQHDVIVIKSSDIESIDYKVSNMDNSPWPILQI